jgi:hypothetical protein
MAFEVEDVHDAFPYWLVFKCLANGHGLSERGRSAVLRLNCLAQLYSVRLFHIAHALTAKPASVFCRSFISVGVQVSARATANLGGLRGRSEHGARRRSPLGPLGMTHLKNNEAPANDRGCVADASHVS